MRYFIKNDLVSFTGSSTVLDEQGRSAFIVKGKFFSPTHKKFICDLDGNTLFTVRNKYWTLFHKHVYIYDNRDGGKRLLCRVRTGLFGRWKIYNNAIGLDLRGRFLQGTYASINGRDVGMFYKDFTLSSMFINDAYTLDVFDESLAPFLVALVVGYDNIRDQQENDILNH